MTDNRLMQSYTNGKWFVSFNGVDITPETKTDLEGRLTFPDWVSKELQEGEKEWTRRNKPINRVLRFLRLYKAKPTTQFIKIQGR
jgi:hypothetical protein